MDSECDQSETDDTWRTHIDSISLDITRQAFRAADRDDAAMIADLSPHVHRVLLKAFDSESKEQTQAHLLTSQLQRAVLDQTALFDPLSPLEISEQQKNFQQQQQQARPSSGGGDPQRRAAPDLEDISRRLAHISIIHWRVWRSLAYLDYGFCIANGVDPEDCFEETETDLELDLHGGRTSSSVPLLLDTPVR